MKYSPSPYLNVSPISVAFKFFLIVALIVGSYQAYTNFYAKSELEKALYRLGYPAEGYTIENGTIRFADGHIAIVQGEYIEVYTVTAAEAVRLAEQYLAEYNAKLKEYDMRLLLDVKTLREAKEGSSYYWVLDVRMKRGAGSSWFVGTIWVDRATGLVKFKGILG